MTSPRPGVQPPQLPGFTFVRLVGKGGFAHVYEFEQHKPRRSVAVKALDEAGIDERSAAEFAVEADLMAQLSAHPAIVTVYDAMISPEGRPCLVMELYDRPNLAERARDEEIPVGEVLSIGIQIAGAVETAHRAGVLHRDIKPANILVNKYGLVGLTDFGIASVHTPEEVDEGPRAMSVPWSPPEVVDPTGSADHRADIWSLGATLYTLLTGRSPFRTPGSRNSQHDLRTRIIHEPLPPTGLPEFKPSLERLLAYAMAKNPNHRPQSAASLAHALQEIQVEMGLATTRPLIEDDVIQRGRSRRQEADEGATVNAPITVVKDAQARDDTTSSTSVRSQLPGMIAGVPRAPDVAAAPRERPRVGIPHEPELSDTAAPPAESPDVGAGDQPASEQSGRRSRLPMIGGAAAVVVIGVAAMLAFGGTPDEPDSLATPTQGTAQDLVGVPAVQDLQISDSSDDETTLTWSAPDGDVDEYQVRDVNADVLITTAEVGATVATPPEGECLYVYALRDGADSVAQRACP